MNYDELHVFLTIVQCGSISAAASRLYTSQSNISARLLNLEKEFGHPLIIRGRGRKNIELTAHGDKVLEIARRMESLNTEIESLKQDSLRQTLSIGATEALTSCTLLPFLKLFSETYPGIRLTLHTYHSTEVCMMVENQTADLGFAGKSAPSGPVISVPLFREPLVLVVHQNSPYRDGIRAADLPAEKEVYVRLSTEYERWHSEHWPAGSFRIQVSTGSMIADYLSSPDLWSIAARSSAERMIAHYPLKMIRCADELPVRAFYMLENKYPRPSRIPAVNLLKQELHEWISRNEILQVESSGNSRII
ncbi:MAG: LysR family transcriptional regulator [Erysipelotrichaceae bacterium]|nr:LysR family transcriptional regulator [Erysipelotrichaceae bacterium]